METGRPIAVKPFVERIEEHCAKLDRNELIGTIVSIGLTYKPRERQGFLDEIGVRSTEARVSDEIDLVLDDVAALLDDIASRLAAIADGTFWSDYAEQTDYSLDDDPPELTDEQTQELVLFLSEADSLFVAGRFADARRVYEPLLRLFRMQDDGEGIDVSAVATDLDIREERARYARCVYETTNPDSRATAMVETMEIAARPYVWCDGMRSPEPMLSDVVNAYHGRMSGFDDFLVAWIQCLEASGLETLRAQRLYLESLAIERGPSALAVVARKWAGDRPIGYVEWISALVQEGEWSAVVDAAREALDRIPEDSKEHQWSRAHAAMAIVEAGVRLNDSTIILDGRRAAFRVEPSDAFLANLIEAASVTEHLQEELSEAVGFLRERDTGDRAVYAKTLIIAGRLGETLAIAKNCEPLGWSYHDRSAGLCFAAILARRVLPDLADYPVIRALLYSTVSQREGYSRLRSVDSDGAVDSEAGSGAILIDHAMRGLGSATLNPNLEDEYVRWAEQIGLRRVDAIVSNLYRGAYERAATILVALAERLTAEGRCREGLELVEEYRAKYNRHSAFKAELDRVVKCSALKVGLRRGGPP